MVSSSLSASEGGESKEARPSLTYTEQFNRLFPYYLSIGMTYNEYWESDPMLAKYYREAEELKRARRNEELWLQGMYIYEALCDVSPIMVAFPKKGAKPNPYPDKPYCISEKQRKVEEAEQERKVAEKGMAFMNRMMSMANSKPKEKPTEKEVG